MKVDTGVYLKKPFLPFLVENAKLKTHLNDQQQKLLTAGLDIPYLISFAKLDKTKMFTFKAFHWMVFTFNIISSA